MKTLVITQRMKTLVITQDLLNANGEYIGADEVSQFDGHIEIAADLGVVKFSAGLRATGRIRSGAGSGIKAGEGIEAGEGIKAGEGIEAGGGIKAGLSINSKTVAAGLRIFAGLYMWRIPEPQEMEIKAELRGGTIAHGNHVTEATKAVPAGDKEAAA